jgi:hypothetical protein
VQALSFAEMLEQAIRRYQNRAIEAARVIEELMKPGPPPVEPLFTLRLGASFPATSLVLYVAAAGDDSVIVGASARGAWKLAAIDHGDDSVPRPDLAPYSETMDRLLGKCPEPEERIGDFAVVGVKELAQKGVRMSHLEFIQGMDESMPSDTKTKLGVKCAEVAAILFTFIDRR